MEKKYDTIEYGGDIVVTLSCTIKDNLGLIKVLEDVKNDLPEALNGATLEQKETNWMTFIIDDNDYNVDYPFVIDEEEDDDNYWIEIEPEEVAKRIKEAESYNLISFGNEEALYDEVTLIQSGGTIDILEFSMAMSGWDALMSKLAECGLITEYEAESLRIGGGEQDE
ncbi:hypothetical protein IKW73_00185 [Candidatus Saccharibacteria bacterium]|nr:hypothetical protein [Candidatus Saccharibacteria bacterium]